MRMLSARTPKKQKRRNNVSYRAAACISAVSEKKASNSLRTTAPVKVNTEKSFVAIKLFKKNLCLST